jgi:hypothetical protein
MRLTATIVAAASMAALANAHGYFTSPKGRQPGSKFEEVCGQNAYNMMAADINGNIQGLLQLSEGQSDYNPSKCNFWKCKVRESICVCLNYANTCRFARA